MVNDMLLLVAGYYFVIMRSSDCVMFLHLLFRFEGYECNVFIKFMLLGKTGKGKAGTRFAPYVSINGLIVQLVLYIFSRMVYRYKR